MKTGWNCPHCQMSLSRHWNMQRHIDRRHGGMGEPVTYNISQYYKDMNPQNFHFPFDYSHNTSLSFLTRKEKSDKKFSEFLDDQILQPLRKMIEYKNLTSQLFTMQQQQRIMPDGGGGGIVYPGILSMNYDSGESNNNLSEHPIFEANYSEIVGYRGNVCEKCSIISIDTIFCHKDGESGQIETTHTCNSKILDDAQLEPSKNKVINEIYEKLPEVMKERVNSWTENSAYLLAIEMPPSVALNNTLEITSTDDSHWASRAIKNKRTILNDDELSDFLHKVRNSTYASFKFISQSLREQQQESSTRHYLMIITDNKIDLSFELLLQYIRELSQ